MFDHHKRHALVRFSATSPSQNLSSATGSAVRNLSRVKTFGASDNASGNAGGISRRILEERGAEASAEELECVSRGSRGHSRTMFDWVGPYGGIALERMSVRAQYGTEDARYIPASLRPAPLRLRYLRPGRRQPGRLPGCLR